MRRAERAERAREVESQRRIGHRFWSVCSKDMCDSGRLAETSRLTFFGSYGTANLDAWHAGGRERESVVAAEAEVSIISVSIEDASSPDGRLMERASSTHWTGAGRMPAAAADKETRLRRVIGNGPAGCQLSLPLCWLPGG